MFDKIYLKSLKGSYFTKYETQHKGYYEVYQLVQSEKSLLHKLSRYVVSKSEMQVHIQRKQSTRLNLLNMCGTLSHVTD